MIGLKKILWFSLSLGLSALVFFVVLAACLFLSGVFDENDEKNPTAPHKNDGFVLNVSVLFADEEADKVFASVLSLNAYEKTVTAKEMDCEIPVENGKTLGEIYKSEGLYPFADAVRRYSGLNPIGFLKLNSNTFVTITDRMKNIVYNEGDKKMLVTGAMALKALDSRYFAEFCSTAGQIVLSSDLKKEFMFLSGLCENDLSYPRLYDITRGN